MGEQAIKRIRLGRLLVAFLLVAALIIGCVKLAEFGIRRYYYSAYPREYQELVERACEEKGLDRALVYAVIRTESGFRPQAESHLGARGLMQMMPDAFEWVRERRGTHDDHYDMIYEPNVSIEYGTTMLRLLFDEFETEENVLCAYHAGWGNTKKWLENPDYAPDGKQIEKIPFPDTAHYVSKVSKAADVYRELYDL